MTLATLFRLHNGRTFSGMIPACDYLQVRTERLRRHCHYRGLLFLKPPVCGPANKGMTMAKNKEDSTAQPSRSRKAPEKSASKSASRSATKRETAASKRAQPKAMAGSRSATKSQTAPAKARSSAGSRTAARSSPGASRSRSTTQARSQGSMLNPMAWLSMLETTLTSPQARAVMAEALRAVANVLEKPQGNEQEQGSGTQQGRDAVSAAGSLGAEIVAAPLQVAAAAIGAAGEVVTSALGGSSGEDDGNGDSRRGSRRSSSRKKASARD